MRALQCALSCVLRSVGPSGAVFFILFFYFISGLTFSPALCYVLLFNYGNADNNNNNNNVTIITTNCPQPPRPTLSQRDPYGRSEVVITSSRFPTQPHCSYSSSRPPPPAGARLSPPSATERIEDTV